MTFEELYEHNLPAVWRYVRARVADADEAEDVTADVFVRALRAWDRYDPAAGSTGAWLFRIAHHTVVDWIRRRTRRPDPPRRDDLTLDAPILAEDEPLESILREDLLSGLRTALARLDDREREAIALRFGGGLRARDVGAVLGISEGAAKMTVHRAVVKLREVMRDHR